MPDVIQRSLNKSVIKLLCDMLGVGSFKRITKKEKATRPEITYEDIKEFCILYKNLESVEEISIRLVGYECQI